MKITKHNKNKANIVLSRAELTKILWDLNIYKKDRTMFLFGDTQNLYDLINEYFVIYPSDTNKENKK